MSEIKKTYVLWSTLAGAISFFISGVIIDIILLRVDIYIFSTIIAGALGDLLLLGLLLRKRHNIGKMTVAGVVAVPVGFWASFFLGYVFSEIPFITERVPGILAFFLMGAMVGGLFGAIIYGRKSIWLFAVVGGIFSLASGIFVDALNWGRFDNLLNVLGIPRPNMLPFILSFGIGIGLSIGLYEMLKQRRADSSSIGH